MRFGLGGVALAAVAAVACGHSSPAVSDGAPTPADAGAREVGPPDADAAVLDTALPRTGRPLPDGVRPPVRLVDGTALLMGNGKSACTHQTPASGDGHRWCVFTLGPLTNDLAALWVIDVTRAATGDVPRCDGTDPGCLRLTDKAFIRLAISFEGDTLIYGTDSVAVGNADFLGRFFAWRPGWTGGRQISSDRAFTCIGNASSAAAACLDDPAGDPAKRDSANVRAGYLTTQAGGPLPVFGRYPLRNDQYNDWQAKFSPDGAFFVLSDADTIGAPQTMRLLPTAMIGQTAPTTALTDVAYWKISNDGQKLYFLRNLHGLDQLSDFYVADFPTGANATLLESELKGYVLVGDRPSDLALQLWKNHPPGGTIELLSNRSMVTPKAIFTHDDFLNGAIVSPDLRYTTWLNDPFRAVVFRNGDLATCAINGPDDPAVSSVSYLAHSSLMFWKEPSPDEPNLSWRDSYYATPEACDRKTRFGRHVDAVTPVDDRGLVYVDELVDGPERGTLKYVGLAPGAAALDPAGAVRVQENVTAPVVLVGANPPLLVFAANGGSADTSGLYVFGPVPF